MRRRVWFAAEHDFTRLENGSHDRQRHQVLFARCREGDLGWRGDMNGMTFCDFVDRHELVEQRVDIVSTRGRWVAVPQPVTPT
jgi:hypothetical protein